MDTGFLLWVMKMFWNLIVGMIEQLCEYMKTIEAPFRRVNSMICDISKKKQKKKRISIII